jgi:hypothetical protein
MGEPALLYVLEYSIVIKEREIEFRLLKLGSQHQLEVTGEPNISETKQSIKITLPCKAKIVVYQTNRFHYLERAGDRRHSKLFCQ